MAKKGDMSPINKAYFKAEKAADRRTTAWLKSQRGGAKTAGPDGPTARLTQSIAIGYGFDIDSIEFVATDQGYFNIAAQLTLAIRPAFRKTVVHLRKVIPGMIKEKLEDSRVIQDLKNQESRLVAALGLANSTSRVSALVEHIVKSVRVRITTTTEASGRNQIQVPQIIWGVAGDKLMSVGEWGSYTSYPSRDSINWAMWLLMNSYRSSGHRIKFGSFSGRQSRTRRAIMIPGGSFSLDQYIDHYEVNFVEDIIDENLAIKVDQIAEKIITEEIAKIPEMEIGKLAGHLQLRANKGVNIDVKHDPVDESGPVTDYGITAEAVARLAELADAKLITQAEVIQALNNEISLDDLLGRG